MINTKNSISRQIKIQLALNIYPSTYLNEAEIKIREGFTGKCIDLSDIQGHISFIFDRHKFSMPFRKK